MRNPLAVSAIAAVLAASFAFATIASGQDNAPAVPVTIPADWLSIAVISERLIADGWTVFAIEAEPHEGKYEACLVDAEGAQIEAEIDPLTAEIVSTEVETCASSEEGEEDEIEGHHDDGGENGASTD